MNQCQTCNKELTYNGKMHNPYCYDCHLMNLRERWRRYPAERVGIEITIERIKQNKENQHGN